MLYEDIRGRIQTGDLIALSHFKWNSLYDLKIQAVRFFTQSEYSHVGLAMVIGGRVFIVESVVPLIRLVPLSNILEREPFYWVPLAREMNEAEMQFALSKIGKGKYSQWQALMSAIRKLRIGEDDLWECAEFVVVSRRMSGLDLGDKATPAAVVQEAQRLGYPVYMVTR